MQQKNFKISALIGCCVATSLPGSAGLRMLQRLKAPSPVKRSGILAVAQLYE